METFVLKYLIRIYIRKSFSGYLDCFAFYSPLPDSNFACLIFLTGTFSIYGSDEMICVYLNKVLNKGNKGYLKRV